MNLKRAFIHGLESSAKGTKGVYFKERFPDMIIEDFIGSFEQRMEKLNNLFLNKENLLLVGSSYGGLMATVFALKNEERVKKLILLAPALERPDLQMYPVKKLQVPTIIYHGKNDDIVCPESVQKIASTLFANLEHNIVDDDHSLHNSFKLMNWHELLEY